MDSTSFLQTVSLTYDTFFHVLRGLKPVAIDILCFCAHLCVVSSCSCGGWETRPKHSHTNLQYGVWQWHNVEVPWRCDGGSHFGWQHPAERSKSNHIRRRCACVRTVQLLERTRDALVSLSSARIWGRWEMQVLFFSQSHDSNSVHFKNNYKLEYFLGLGLMFIQHWIILWYKYFILCDTFSQCFLLWKVKQSF